jgi:hypothetical protein
MAFPYYASVLLESTILCLLNDIHDLPSQAILHRLDLTIDLSLEGASDELWKNPAEEVFIVCEICWI